MILTNNASLIILYDLVYRQIETKSISSKIMNNLFRYPLNSKSPPSGSSSSNSNNNQGMQQQQQQHQRSSCKMGSKCQGIGCNHCWSFRIHAPPMLPNSHARTTYTAKNASIELLLHNVRHTNNNKNNMLSNNNNELLTVTNLRQVYSQLLEEMAPNIYEMGTSTTYRDKKNNGVVTVEGDESTGYDYSYTPGTYMYVVVSN